ncbi:MAG TPA: hypothetical protein VFO31_18095 [Vicinamibacterales bacterium]|nr:hypothetical protein [Vicinamibacterales bacterium]
MKKIVLTASVALVLAADLQAQTVALNRVMRQKLVDAQSVLAAVVTDNWRELDRGSRALIKATEDPAWMVLQSPEYTKQSQAFVFAVNDLVEVAARRDAEAAPLAYAALTMRCVQCHRFVARARLAGK